MTNRDLGAEHTFDIVASGHETRARLARRRIAPLAVGAAVLSVGILVGGRLGSGLTVCGLILLARGVDRKALGRWLKRQRAARNLRPRSGEHRRDEVDQASWESFPASDPPAFTPASSR